MKHYNKILEKFSVLGYGPRSTFTQASMYRALNDIAATSDLNIRFDPDLAAELWQQVLKDENGQTDLREIILTINEGLFILEQRFTEIENELKLTEDKAVRKKLLIELFSTSTSYDLLSQPFGISPLKNSQYFYQSMLIIPEQIRNQNNAIFSMTPNHETVGLKIVLWVAMLTTGLELAMMFYKFHFYTLMCLCSVLCIFFLNYFDSFYIKIVIINLIVSCFFDVIWEICNAKAYWNDKYSVMTCHQSSSLLKFITVFVVIVSVGKMLMTAILFKYRSNPQNMIINFEFLDVRFKLDGNPKNNPVTMILTEK